MMSKGKMLWGALIGTMLASALWTWWPISDAADRLAGFPLKGLLYDSRAVPLTTAERDIFGEATVLKRLVRVNQRTLLVTVIDGSGNRHAVHDPLFCLRGAGWKVTSHRPVSLEIGQAERVELAMNDRRAEAMYWFTDGHRAYSSALRYWGQTTLRRLTFGSSGEEPLLIIMATIDGKPYDWDEALSSLSILTDL